MIPIGFEIETGDPVEIPEGHTIFLGATQRAGKTTALEKAAVESGLKCLAFLSKRGEQSFRTGRIIPAYYSDARFDWQVFRALSEALTGDRVTEFQRKALRIVCEDGQLGKRKKRGKPNADFVSWNKPTNLAELERNIDIAYEAASLNLQMTFAELRADLKLVKRELARLQLPKPPRLLPGINIVDLENESRHIQSLVIADMIHWVREKGRRTIVALPEIKTFAPGNRRTPVNDAAKEFIRVAAALGNFLWMDSQTLNNLSDEILSQVRVWVFGVQRTAKQIERALELIPESLERPHPSDIQTLKLGHFWVAYDDKIFHTYVQPIGVNSLTAEAIARGWDRPETAQRMMEEYDRERKETYRRL